jgi:hypothetical protein
MKIELTKEEAQFIFENISQLNVPLSNPNADKIAALGRSVLTKLEKATADEVKAAK